jgi:MtrB/PioB family decaheme-associated outer membrane protein
MRTPIASAAFICLLPAVAGAQQFTPPPGTTGFFDFGGRGTSTTGDAARYERYRDMGNGLFLENARLVRDRDGWIVAVNAEHVGRSDQRYQGMFQKPGRFKGWLSWDQIPMVMSFTTQTLFVPPTGDEFTIEDPLQQQVQNNVNNLPAVFDANKRTFDTKSQRDVFITGFQFLPTQELSLNAQFRHMNRDGSIPYGGSFGHSSLVEIPAPVKHSTNDLEGSAEFQKDQYLLRAGYSGSWFHNEITELAYDSPFRLTDITGTPGRGRNSLPPSNSFVQVNGLAEVKLPGRSRASAYISFGSLSDAGDPLMPQTINTANTPAPVERGTVEGHANTSSMRFTFVSRPLSNVDFSAKYRTYDYDNQTPEFHLTQRVSYDNTPGNATMSSLGGVAAPPVHTEPFSLNRQAFEAELNFRTGPGLRAGVGYVYYGEERDHRAIVDTSENGIRLTFDALANQYFTLRSRYEHSAKRGDTTDETERELFRIGEQPQIRHFDIASRDRDRFTLLGTVSPLSTLSLNASVTVGNDDYLESVFGVRDNKHRIYSLGADVLATETVTVSGSYTYEKYFTLSRSRQANPPSPTITYEQFLSLNQQTGHGVQVADASRNWATNANDRTHTFFFNADFMQVRGSKVDVSLSYDYSKNRGTYDYITGPVEDRTLPEEVVIDTTLPPPTALPPTKSVLNRGTLDLIYNVSARIGIGMSVWYEDYDVQDFTLDEENNQQLARGSTLLMGYLYRPYTATTVWGRLLYRW